MKYVDTLVSFAEFPKEISLCINISNCPCHCKGCHSSYLSEDIGEVLNKDSLFELINKNNGISCVGFMGGDASPNTVNYLAKFIKDNYPNLKVGWYSGKEEISKEINPEYFDYIKVGPYIEEYGPINKKTTNQRFYTKGILLDKLDANPNMFYDTTSQFWKNDKDF